MPSFNCTLADGSVSRESVDSFFLLSFGMIVFFLQAGFAMLEAGCVSSRNVTVSHHSTSARLTGRSL
jgi:ammonia channel protein AmtB